MDPSGTWAVNIPLSFGSYLYLADKGWVKGLTKIYVSLYMTAGGFAVNAVGAIIFGSGQIVAAALRAAGVSFAAKIGWAVANLVRSLVWKYSISSALRLAKSSGAYAQFFWIRTYIYVLPLIV